MNLSSILCTVFGHQPVKYEYEEPQTHHLWWECSRCNQWKDLNNPGWTKGGSDE